MRCRLALAVSLSLLLGACDTVSGWMGERETTPLPGARVSVLALETELVPDPGIADLEVTLPEPVRNPDWPQAGGNPSHVLQHLALGEQVNRAWRANAGTGTSSTTVLGAQPVVAGDSIYTLDAESQVSAFSTADGRRRWRVDLTPEAEESGAIGGGLAVADGMLFATTGYGEVVALAPGDGATVWKQRLGTPLRVAPTATDGRVFVIGFDNELTVLASSDGRILWTHAGIAEDANLQGGASVAVEGGVAVAPYSSGELVGLRVENGRVIWQDQLIRVARYTPLASLNEIRGSPVIDGSLVVAVSHAGRMVAVDLRSGDRIWERDIEGVETPWVAGEFIYIVSTDAELLCLSRRDGRIRWVTQLPRYTDPDDRSGQIFWSGPVLAGGRLILVSSNGKAAMVSPATGEIAGGFDLQGAATVPPLVADGTLYVLTDNAELTAYR
jgi:outer membrane protein assembly factor BamB